MNEVGISLHGHFSEGHSNEFKPIEGKSPPLWCEQESRTARVSVERWEGQDIRTSHCPSSGNIHTQIKRGYGPLDHSVATMLGSTRHFTWIFTGHSLL